MRGFHLSAVMPCFFLMELWSSKIPKWSSTRANAQHKDIDMLVLLNYAKGSKGVQSESQYKELISGLR